MDMLLWSMPPIPAVDEGIDMPVAVGFMFIPVIADVAMLWPDMSMVAGCCGFVRVEQQ